MMVRKLTNEQIKASLNFEGNLNSKLHPCWTLPWEDIKEKPSYLGEFKLGDDVWVLHADFFVGQSATEKHKAARKISFKTLENIGFEDVEGVKRRIKRISWMSITSPKGAISTSVGHCQQLIKLIAKLPPLLSLHYHLEDDFCPDGPELFGQLSQDEYRNQIPNHKMREGQALIHYLNSKNWIDDDFGFIPERYLRSSETNNAGSVVYGAYSDQEITSILQQCFYFSSLTDLVIAFDNWEAEQIKLINQGQKSAYRLTRTGRPQFAYHTKYATTLHRSTFLDPMREKLINQGRLKRNGEFKYSFGAKGEYVTINGFRSQKAKALSLLIELSHRLLVAFFTGVRDQEVFQLDLDCLADVKDEEFTRIFGRDLKSDESLDGSERDWPLPTVCVEIIERQKELMQALYPERRKLFRQETTTSYVQPIFNSNCNVPEDKSTHMLKRMRPTIASLVMTASHKPLAVTAVLGHATMDQSLSYARSNPRLQEELLEQDRIIKRAWGNEIIENVISGKASNKLSHEVIEMSANIAGDFELAKKAQKKVDLEIIENGAELFQAMSSEVRETSAEHLGSLFSEVQPGIACFANGDFNGRCSDTKGVKNPTNCAGAACKYARELYEDRSYRSNMVEYHLDELVNYEVGDAGYRHNFNEALTKLWGFEGTLERYRKDLRLQTISQAFLDEYSDVNRKTLFTITAWEAWKDLMGDQA
jgi:integrase